LSGRRRWRRRRWRRGRFHFEAIGRRHDFGRRNRFFDNWRFGDRRGLDNRWRSDWLDLWRFGARWRRL
jgi:hypothetical protein